MNNPNCLKCRTSLMRSSEGFTLIELVVTLSIIATLAAFAVPTYMKEATKAKAVSTISNITTIGGSILQAYSNVVGNGDAGGNAIATFSVAVNTEIDTTTNPEIISYRSDGSGSIRVTDLFPGGASSSPFDQSNYIVTAVTPGTGTWALVGDDPTLILTVRPSITIADQAQPSLNKTFRP